MTVFANVVSGTFPGETWSFTLHTEGTGSITSANSAAVAFWNLLWGGVATPTDSIKQLIPTTVESVEVSTASLDPVTGKQVARVITPDVKGGTNANDALPPQCSIAVSLRTASATRSGRGRFYLPVFAVDKDAAGVLDGTSQSEVAAAAQGALQSLVSAAFVPVIYHRSTKSTTNVTSIDVGNVFDTQRRRRDKLIETRVSLAL